MSPRTAAETGEVLKLGPPCAGQVVIKVDPALTGATFSAGIQTLLPGAEIPVQRHLQRDLVWFIHKGQGRAVLEDAGTTVVPGVMLSVPRQAWHGLRNTGTGALEFAWVAAPAGFEVFARALSRLGPAPDAAAVQELAHRHGIEYRPGGGPVQPPPRGRRRGRGGRRRGTRPQTAAAQPPAHAPGPSPSVPSRPVTAPAIPSGQTPPGASSPRRRRRRRGRGGKGGGQPPAQRAAQLSAPQTRPSPAPRGPRQERSRGGRRQGRGWGRVKEVYMGGRWVRVSGEGPVIASGAEEGRRRRGEGDEPMGPLTVPL